MFQKFCSEENQGCYLIGLNADDEIQNPLNDKKFITCEGCCY